MFQKVPNENQRTGSKIAFLYSQSGKAGICSSDHLRQRNEVQAFYGNEM